MPIAFAVKFRDPVNARNYRPGEFEVWLNTPVVAETDRGVELGRVARGPLELTPDQELPALLRLATADDLAQDEDNRAAEQEAYAICLERIQQHKLPMKLAGVEYTLDRSRLQFFFTSESRVDFRELVKDLAASFATRIQLTQIGARDHAKMLGGCGICGRDLCCSTWLKSLDPIGIKMAKEQHLPLTPTKISGVCGKLMCCLKYEYEWYRQQNKKLPKVGKKVETPHGDAVVESVNAIKEEVTVRTLEGGVHTCPAASTCPKRAAAQVAMQQVRAGDDGKKGRREDGKTGRRGDGERGRGEEGKRGSEEEGKSEGAEEG